MNISLNRTLYRIFLLLSFLMVNALIVYGISAVLSYMNTGADRASILHSGEDIEESYLPKVTWDLTKGTGRSMEDHTLRDITTGYLSSWRVRNNSYLSNDKFGLSDYYTDSAKVKLYRTLALNKDSQIRFDQTSITHHPELKYYSADGKLVVFTDHGATLYRESLKNDERVLTEKLERTYQVLMLLEDGFWRVRHMVDMSSEKPIRTQDTISKKLGNPAAIKGINYYPKEAPWAMFGPKFNDSIINADFKIIKDMGLNTVRLFINYEEFGKNKLRKDKMKKMKKVMDLAQAHQLKAIITLFDFYGNYEIYDWTRTHRHAEKVVKALRKHPALLGWDLKNEPDLDFESRGKHTVLAWLREMNAQIKKWDPAHPITVGWSNTQAAVNLANDLDYVSFHYYEDLALFPERIASLRKAVPHKQLVLQEYGLSSYSGPWNGFSGSEGRQAEYYREIQQQLLKEELPFLFWTLYDFEDVPNRVAGWQPWRKNKQGFFGCIDVDGNKKEAYYELLQTPKRKGKE